MFIGRAILLAAILLGIAGPAFAYLPDEEERAIYAARKTFYASLLGGTGSAEELRAALDSANPLHRAAAAFLLTDLVEDDAIPALRRLLDDPSPMVRGEALTALTRFRDPADLAAAMAATDNPDPTLRLVAVRGVARYHDQPGAAAAVERALRRALEDELAEVRSLAAVELARAVGSESVPALQDALEREDDPAVRTVLELQLEALAAPDAPRESPR